MTAFIVVCAAMLAAALLWITLPLLRPKAVEQATATRGERRVATITVVVSISAIAVAMYAGLSNWDWNAAQTEASRNADVETMLQNLEAKLKANPQDVEGWLMLGRSYTAMGRFARAVDAYQQAYDLTQGENVEAVIGLGEALALVDEASLSGRAGQLFNAALEKAPTHPKALWYASMAALQSGDLRVGRDRLRTLLAQNPPEQLRGILERQVQDLDQQLGEAGEGGPAAGAPATVSAAPAGTQASQQRVIRASISIAPEIQQKLQGATPLFVLARDPSGGGPPLAVQRRSSTEAPFTVELSERDAMMPSRTIAGVPRVQVVARLSRSGAPQASSGDFYGEADYDFGKDTGTVRIIIDRIVP